MTTLTKKTQRRINHKGQAISEYILLMAVIFGLFLLTLNTLSRTGFPQALANGLLAPFSASYQYGHPLAKGPDNGGPIYLPSYQGGQDNFRIFLNPRTIQ